MKRVIRYVLIIFIINVILAGGASATEEIESDWWFPYIGRFNGNWDLSVGAHFWNDHFKLRNLQLKSNIDLAPGIRVNSILRSNKKLDTIEGFDPNFDELYIESYGYHYGQLGTLSGSLKIGKMRYLRFPNPDLISTFDQVPGTEDLRYEDTETGYNGQMLTLDYNSKYGLGYHITGINWGFGERDGSNLIENYIFYRDKFGMLDFEARAGDLPLRHPGGPVKREGRPYQLGRSGPGYSFYLGFDWKGYKVGALYENLLDEKFDERDIRTGIMVTFNFSKITEFLGKVRFDYTRSPEGFVNHLPLLEGRIGSIKDKAPEGAVLVGEIEAKRIITYWQNGQGRNFYEHRLSHWGNVDPDKAIVVIDEQPWYLRLESLVSPHTSFKSLDDIKEWEKDRQGPAQLEQKVSYKFYQEK